MMRPGIRFERELGLVARLDLVQLVLVVEERTTVPVASTSVITGVIGSAATKPPGRSCRLIDVAVAGRARGGLVEVPVRVLELRADLRDLRDIRRSTCAPSFCCTCSRAGHGLRLAGARLRLGAARRVELALSSARSVSACSRSNLCRRRRRRARGTARRACARGRASRRPRRSWPCACAIAPARLGDLRLRALERLLRARCCCALALASCASSVLTCELVRRRVDAKQHVALLHQPVASSTGTSITRPRTCETIGTV